MKEQASPQETRHQAVFYQGPEAARLTSFAIREIYLVSFYKKKREREREREKRTDRREKREKEGITEVQKGNSAGEMEEGERKVEREEEGWREGEKDERITVWWGVTVVHVVAGE